MMFIEQLSVGTMRNFCYLARSEETGEGFVVDPGFSIETIVKKAQEIKLNINIIFLTHHHYDHVDCAASLKARTGAKILAHEATERLLKGNISIDGNLSDNEVLKFGSREFVKVIHTPGHAPGAICLIVDDKWLITGDTLFIGNCGRTDLPGGNSLQLFNSLQRLKQLPDHLIILPGHHYGEVTSRSLGEEKQKNPVFIVQSYQEFEKIP